MTCLPGIAPGGHHCRHAGLSVDGYAGLGTEAAEAFAASKGRYGYRGIRAMLGAGVSEKAVRGIMAEGDPTAHVPRRRRYGPHEGDVFCQIFVGRFGVSFSPFERLFLGRFGFGQSCGLSVIA